MLGDTIEKFVLRTFLKIFKLLKYFNSILFGLVSFVLFIAFY